MKANRWLTPVESRAVFELNEQFDWVEVYYSTWRLDVLNFCCSMTLMILTITGAWAIDARFGLLWTLMSAGLWTWTDVFDVRVAVRPRPWSGMLPRGLSLEEIEHVVWYAVRVGL